MQEPAIGVTPVAGYSAALDVAEPELIRELHQAAESSRRFADLVNLLSEIIQRQTCCFGLWGLEAKLGDTYSSPVPLTKDDSAEVWALAKESAFRLAKVSSQRRNVCSFQLSSQHPTELLVVPVEYRDGENKRATQWLVGCFSTDSESVLRLQWLFGLVQQTILVWRQRQEVLVANQQAKSLKDAFAMIETINQTHTISTATKLFVNHLQRMTHAGQVGVAFGNTPESLKMEAVSGVELVNQRASSVESMRDVCQQAMLIDQPVVRWDRGKQDNRPADALQLAMDKCCQDCELDCCLMIQLNYQSDVEGDCQNPVFGILILMVSREQTETPGFEGYVLELVRLLGGHLEMAIRANENLVQRARRQVRSWRSANVPRMLAIGVSIMLLLMLIPMPYRVGCDCTIEPTQRRYVAAPYEGVLESSTVRSGDLVEEGQVVAVLDGRQLRIKLAALKADLEGAKKRKESTLANGEIAQSQIAKSEMKRHLADIKLAQQQLENLEVRSPIDGVIVSGDLQRAHGAPVELGQTLFEVAPLETMVAEVGIPESEIGYVMPGMSVDIKLDAYPLQTFRGQIELIEPRAQVLDGQSVFIADVAVQIDESSSGHFTMRPGMRGSAKVDTGLACLGWNLLHRPWESVRYWTVW